MNRSMRIVSLMLLAAALELGTSATAGAATLYWDRDNATGLQGGTGHWRTSGGGANGTSWNNVDGTGSRATWTNGSDAVFNATGGGDANVNGTVTVASIYFAASGFATSGGGTIELTGPNITTDFDATMMTTIDGSVGLTKLGSARLTLSKANTYTGTTTVTTGTLALGIANVFADTSDILINGGMLDIATFSDTVNSVTVTAGTIVGTTGVLSATSFIIVEDGVTIDAILAGASAPLTKQDAGTTILSKANSYGGETKINAGILKLNGAGAINASTKIDIAAGAVFDVTGVTGGTYTIQNGQKLGGSGTSLGHIVVGAGAALAPGNSPGTMTHTGGDLEWASGGSYEWEINLLAGSQGNDPGWDWINVTDGNAIDVTATSASAYTIAVTSLTGTNVAGVLSDWDPSVSHSWVIASASGGVTGFDEGDIVVDSTQFELYNSLDGGVFSVTLANGDTDIVLEFTSAAALIPEPTSGAVTIAIVGLLGAGGRRRRR